MSRKVCSSSCAWAGSRVELEGRAGLVARTSESEVEVGWNSRASRTAERGMKRTARESWGGGQWCSDISPGEDQKAGDNLGKTVVGEDGYEEEVTKVTTKVAEDAKVKVRAKHCQTRGEKRGGMDVTMWS